MKALGVILLAIVTSIATTVGVHVADQRFHFLTKEAPAAARPKHAVPSLMGLTEADAKTNLDALGLKLVVGARQPSAEAREGTVIDQSPKAGESLSAGEAVTLTFAAAQPKVPDVVGKSATDATQALGHAGYVVKVGDPVANDKLAPGTVAAQAPAAGEPLAAKATVTIQVAAGAADVKVPKLVGLRMAVAKAEAEKLGFKVAIQWTDVGGVNAYQVLKQEPAAGVSAKPGSDVKLVVNREEQ